MIYLLYLFYYGKIENGSSQTDAKKHIIHHYRGVKGVELQLHLAKIQNCLVLFSSSSFFLSSISSVRIQIKVLLLP